MGVVGVAFLVVGGYVLWTTLLSPEARVASVVKNAAFAAETVDAEKFLSHFAPEYRDFLHPNRNALEVRVEDGFGRVDRMNVTLQSIRVDVDGTDAVASFELMIVVFRGEERFPVLGTPFQPELIRATLRREASGWMFVRAESGPPSD